MKYVLNQVTYQAPVYGPTPAPGSNDTQLATTAFVVAFGASGGGVPVGGAYADYATASVDAYYNGLLANVIDCNTLAEGTRVLVGSGGGNTNQPLAGFVWYIETIRPYVAGALLQRAWLYAGTGNTGVHASRSYNGSTWSTWGIAANRQTTLAGYGITDALSNTGGSLSGGLDFGSTVAASTTDLTRHLSLYAGSGFNVTASRLNYSTGISHRFIVNGTDIFTIGSGGATVVGDFTSDGLILTNTLAASVTDLSKQIALWANYGFSITNNRLNYVVPTGGNHKFIVNGVDIGTFSNTGLVVGGTISGSNLSGTNTGDQNLAPYATSASPTLTGGTVDGNPIGYRNIPMTGKNVAYTFIASDAGKGVWHNDATSRAYTVPASIFGQGDILTVANESGTATCTLVPGSGMTMYLAGTATTGTRTVAARGLASIYIGASGTSCYVSGPGVT